MAWYTENIDLGLPNASTRRSMRGQAGSRLIDVQTPAKLEKHTVVEHEIAVVQIRIAPQGQRYAKVAEEIARRIVDGTLLVSDCVCRLEAGDYVYGFGTRRLSHVEQELI